MAVRIRLKKMGRKHKPFYRLCAMDAKTGRDGRVIEELGIYDPLVPDTDARAVLNGERIAYWMGVGAQPSDKAVVLIRKYGKDGSRLAAQKAALEKIAARRQVVAVAAAQARKGKGGKAPSAAEAAEAASES